MKAVRIPAEPSAGGLPLSLNTLKHGCGPGIHPQTYFEQPGHPSVTPLLPLLGADLGTPRFQLSGQLADRFKNCVLLKNSWGEVLFAALISRLARGCLLHVDGPESSQTGRVPGGRTQHRLFRENPARAHGRQRSEKMRFCRSLPR